MSHRSSAQDKDLLDRVLGEELLECGDNLGGLWTHSDGNVNAVVDGDRIGVWSFFGGANMVLVGLGDPDLIDKVRAELRERLV
jgi:hypothetical protein